VEIRLQSSHSDVARESYAKMKTSQFSAGRRRRVVVLPTRKQSQLFMTQNAVSHVDRVVVQSLCE